MHNYYIAEKVPDKYKPVPNDGSVWYCHLKGFPHVPVMGSIGEKAKAVKVCRQMNLDGRVRYS